MTLTKIIAIVCIAVIISNTYLSFVKAGVDPYKDLFDWITQNLEIVAFFVYRGPDYQVIGDYQEPYVTFALKNSPDSKVTNEYTVPYSQFINEYVKKEKVNTTATYSYIGRTKLGPITFVTPSVNITLPRAPDLDVYYGGSYLLYNFPVYEETLGEGDLTHNTKTFHVAEPIFFKHPEYYYSYLSLSNGSSITVPKGESVILALSVKNSDKFEILKSI